MYEGGEGRTLVLMRDNPPLSSEPRYMVESNCLIYNDRTEHSCPCGKKYVTLSLAHAQFVGKLLTGSLSELVRVRRLDLRVTFRKF